MKRLSLLFLTLALAACSFAPITADVPDVTLPGNDSLGLICYDEVTEKAPANFRQATYSATATYSSSVPGNQIAVQIYGRAEAPADICVSPSAADIVLSESFSLRAGASQRVEVGGARYGNTLADLVVNDRYWLGATVTGGVLLSAEERITLTDGVIRAFF